MVTQGFEGTDAELLQLYQGGDTASNQSSQDGIYKRPYYRQP